jgi:exodeoxyribonuclease VII small subunit
MAKKKAASSKAAISFEEAISTIETIVDKLESGELDLTDSLKQYETGIKRLRQCHEILEKAEQKVTLLSGFDADGNPVTESMPETQFRGVSKGSDNPLAGGSIVGDVDDSAGLF